MNEGGGGLGSRTNTIYRSTNGGTTWTSSNTGAAFPGPGQSTCGYFAAMFPSYWRHMGWGDIGAGPSGIIHYAYAQHGTGSDYGDVYYVRSTDNGSTWSTPLKMNTDGGTRSQWQPSLSVSPGRPRPRQLVRRPQHDGQQPRALRPALGRQRRHVGQRRGDERRRQPAAAAAGRERPGLLHGRLRPQLSNDGRAYIAWVDGRVADQRHPQQDVFFDKHPVGPPPPPSPNLVHDLTTLFDGNSNGFIEPGETFGLDERVRNAGNADANGISGVLTSPTPGITITTGNSTYPDIPAGGNGHEPTRFQGSASARLACGDDVSFHLVLTATEGTYNVNFSVPTAPCPNYTITTQTGQPIIPGTADTGNHCDDCTTPITFPFPVYVYGQSYTLGERRVERDLQFGGDDERVHERVPADRAPRARRSSRTGTTCCTDGSGEGIFTALDRHAPEPHFYIEWRAHYYRARGTANFEAIFNENDQVLKTLYGATTNGGSASTEACRTRRPALRPSTAATEPAVRSPTDLRSSTRRPATATTSASAATTASATATTAASATATATATASTTTSATTSATATSTSATTTATTASATTTSAATSATTTATSATSANGALPGAEGDRTEARQGEDEDPPGALLRRSHPPRPLEAGRPCDRPEPEARRIQAPRLPGQPGRRPQVTKTNNWGRPSTGAPSFISVTTRGNSSE